jgi:hypothetical protein
MINQATKRFWKAYWSLPENTRVAADKAFALLVKNPSHPSLQFKKIGKFYSARVDTCYRALAFKQNGEYTWVWLGPHDEYEQLLK